MLNKLISKLLILIVLLLTSLPIVHAKNISEPPHYKNFEPSLHTTDDPDTACKTLNIMFSYILDISLLKPNPIKDADDEEFKKFITKKQSDMLADLSYRIQQELARNNLTLDFLTSKTLKADIERGQTALIKSVDDFYSDPFNFFMILDLEPTCDLLNQLAEKMTDLNDHTPGFSTWTMPQLVNLSIQYLTYRLDPHSSLRQGADTLHSNEMNQHLLVGVGIEWLQFKHKVKADSSLGMVQRVFWGSPNEGIIQPGDIIVNMDGTFRGAEGSTLQVDIKRWNNNSWTEKHISLTRKSFTPFLSYAERINPDIGYIRFNQFTSHTADEIQWLLTESIPEDSPLRESVSGRTSPITGVKSLIIDLRSNGGGRAKGAIKSLDHFIDSINPLAWQVDNTGIAEVLEDGSETIEITEGSLSQVPLVVLIGQNTASSAELFASDCEKLGRCITVGQQTKGKGTAQSFKAMGHQLMAITSVYWTDATGFSPQLYGVSPLVSVATTIFDQDRMEDYRNSLVEQGEEPIFSEQDYTDALQPIDITDSIPLSLELGKAIEWAGSMKEWVKHYRSSFFEIENRALGQALSQQIDESEMLPIQWRIDKMRRVIDQYIHKNIDYSYDPELAAGAAVAKQLMQDCGNDYLSCKLPNNN